MLNYREALTIVLKNAQRLPSEMILVEEAISYILAEDVYSEIDMPPFNKSAVDGYAVKARDTRDAPVKLKCIGLIQAGGIFKKKMVRGECVKIMTGAPLPRGADSVVMIEDTTISDKFVTIKRPVSKGQNVSFKGEDIQKENRVLEKNGVVCGARVALLATVGRRFVKVFKKPEVTILNTGGEIVPPGRKLSRGKIYNSNGPQLAALLTSDGITPRYLGITEDNPKELMHAIGKGLKSDIFLISGGVSMGDYDFVPIMLKRAGVRELFHRINIKPGRPLFFGKKAKTLIFGIPGNPVSNFLIYQLFIRPAVHKMSGYSTYWPMFEKGILKRSFRQKTGRTHFVLAAAEKRDGTWYLDPVASHGSADVLALSRSNAFMVVGKHIDYLRAKSKVEVLLWDEGQIFGARRSFAQ